MSVDIPAALEVLKVGEETARRQAVDRLAASVHPDAISPLLRAVGVDRMLCGEVGEWLSQIDLVKFAGERPPSDQVDSSVQALRDMVERTTSRVTEDVTSASQAKPGLATGTGG